MNQSNEKVRIKVFHRCPYFFNAGLLNIREDCNFFISQSIERKRSSHA